MKMVRTKTGDSQTQATAEDAAKLGELYLTGLEKQGAINARQRQYKASLITNPSAEPPEVDELLGEMREIRQELAELPRNTRKAGATLDDVIVVLFGNTPRSIVRQRCRDAFGR
jgi:hypothetical protein